VPTGGSTGEILAKLSDTSFDMEWAPAVQGLVDAPSDGSAYGRKDTVWINLPELGHDHAADGVTFNPFAPGMVATDVQAAIEENDASLDTHVGISNIHYVDAPADGQEWVRINAGWGVNTGGSGGIGDAPIDGLEYVRKDAAWIVGSGGIAEAPIDGSPYIRKDGGWSSGVDAAHGHAATGVTFSNGASGLSATDVQAALDEIDANADTHIVFFHMNEAPVDAKLYGRQDAAWLEVSNAAHVHTALETTFDPSSSGLTGISVQAAIDQLDANVLVHTASFHMPEAPNDGAEYVRRNLAWAVASGGGGGGAPVAISATPPATPAFGDLWMDPDELDTKVWYDDGNSTQWVSISGAVMPASAGVVHIGPTAPTSPNEGQLWIDDADLEMLVWYDDGDSAQWVPPKTATSGGIGDAPSDAKLYGRQDAAWVEVVGGGGGVPEAPDDAALYGRRGDVTNAWEAAATAAHIHTAAVVTYSNGASGMTATQVQAAIDEVDGRIDTLETAPPAHTHLEADITDLNRVEWRNIWLSGTTYFPQDFVKDGSFVAIANTTTTERPAPVQIVAPGKLYSGVDPTQDTSAKQVIAGQRYTGVAGRIFNVTALRYWTVIGYHYVAFMVTAPGTPEEKTTILLDFTAISAGWQEINVTEDYIFDGDVVDFLVAINEPDPTPTEDVLSYDYVKPNNPATPTAGQISHANNAISSLRVHKTDQVGDQSTILDALTVGDTITIGTMEWSILAITDNTTWLDFSVVPAQQWGTLGIQDVTFESVTATPITNLRDANYYTTDPEITVDGLFTITGDISGITPDDHAYGVDIVMGEVSLSADWDLLPIGGGASSGSGGNVEEAPSDGTPYARQDAAWTAAVAIAHTHVKADITDFAHTHVEADITDMADYALISGEDELAGKMQLAVVATLPGTPDVNTLYFVTT